MLKKVQRKRIRSLSINREKEPTRGQGFNFREAITVLGGITGLVVAVLWIAGRFYANGYFAAMNIPLSQISYSIWEYAEASWIRLLVYFFRTISAPLFLISISLSFFLLALSGLQALLPKLKILEAFNNLRSSVRKFFNLRSATVMVSVGLIVFYYLLLTLGAINKAGRTDGLKSVLIGSYSVEVYSKDYLPLGPYTLSATQSALFQYTSLRLLIYNSGKYFLFRDVDSVTCQPVQVYVIDDNENVHFVLGEITPVDAPCAAAITGVSVPTPTSVP